MSTITATDFQATAANALERMAFVITEPGLETAGEVLANAGYSALIEITGEEPGDVTPAYLVVSATRGFVGEVAAGMMGMDPGEIDVDEHGEATVAELANILGGELVMAMGGDERPLRLGLPQSVTDEAAGTRIDAVADGKHGWTCVLKSESGLLLVGCRTH